MFVRASAYFLACTFRNRTVAMLGKLRQPKYLIGMALTVAYFWLIFFANPWFESSASEPELRRRNATWILAGFYLLQVVVTWFALSSGRGVAFREAEVQLLFPRPFTRWQILRLKWLAAQFPVLLGALLIGLMFLRFDAFHYGFVVVGFLVNSTVLYANATLVGLVLARLKARRRLRGVLLQLPGWSLLAALAGCLWIGWRQVGGARTWAEAEALLATPAVAGFLRPFTALAESMTAADLPSFALALVYPLVLIAVHGFLVWRLDLPFEDQAVEIAEKIQNLSKDGMAALSSKADLVVTRSNSPWELAPTGPPWRALVWKNVISMGRVPRRMLVRIGIVVLVMGAVLASVIVDEGDVTTRIGLLILMLGFYGSLLAPSFVRVDLRIDIPHFDVLKAMPIRGRSLIVGEIMATVAVMWVVQMFLTILAAFLITREGNYVFTWADKLPLLLAMAVGYFAVDFVLVTTENLLALWMPGYVRLGRGLRPGFDQMGQNLIGALVRMLVLMVTVLPPAVVGAVVGAVVTAFGMGAVGGTTLGTVCGSLLLVGEVWLLIVWSEARYERFDITSEKIVEGE